MTKSPEEGIKLVWKINVQLSPNLNFNELFVDNNVNKYLYANRIGYLAGVKETADEFKMKSAKMVVLRDPLYAYH